ncbi:MAG: putative sulfate exporter family transporter [Longimicrobiales bacterium]
MSTEILPDPNLSQPTEREGELRKLLTSEDYWSIWFAVAIFAVILAGWVVGIPRVGQWTGNPLEAFEGVFGRLILLGVSLATFTTIGVAVMKEDWRRYLAGFVFIYVLAVVSYLVAQQTAMRSWGLGYAIWALAFGLLVANTVGTPLWVLKGARSELFVKTGLVLLGGEILFSEILDLGAPGLMVAWFVTPTVIFFMWLLGTRILRLQSKTLTIIIAAATSVCGVSAAIAVAAACRARKSELTLGVGMTMIFTVLMMVAMPALAKLMGLSEAVGGAWLGGTIDSTGAVVAAGAFLGDLAEKVAAVVKMIQNVLIGVVAFLVALFWVTRVDRQPGAPRPGAMEIWYRFPKFILGFAAASVVFSFILMPLLGHATVSGTLDLSSSVRGWFFCLAFVSIGLESNFKELAKQLVGGKPIILYAVGQTFNVVLTLIMAWIAFGGLLFAPVQ